MLKTVVNNCRLLFLWIDNQIIEIKTEEKEEEKIYMSGHSKFANIKHKKEKNDAAKGKVFTMIGREIAVAVKAGGPEP